MRTLERIKTFSIEEVEAMVKEDVIKNACQKNDKNIEHNIQVEGYDVYTTSLRYKTFIEKGYKCAYCDRVGTHYILEHPIGSNAKRAHFNLYADDGMLMTKDHILPKSMGGKDCIENMQTMCEECNSRKGNVVQEGFTPVFVPKKKKKDNRDYIWYGAKKFASMDKAVHVMAHGNKKAFKTVKNHIRESIKNGTPYCGEVWRYGKEIEV